jgi:hypothetical protein
MQRLEESAGIDYEQVSVDTVADVSAHVFGSLKEFASPAVDVTHVEPAFYEAFYRRRAALVRAVEKAAPDWSPAERRAATAVLDLLWDVTSYHRVVSSWHVEDDDAIAALGWAITLLTDAIAAGTSPLRREPKRAKRRR